MQKLLILVSLVCCLTVVKAQEFCFDIFFLHSEITDRDPTALEFVGMSLMSVGGCIVGVESTFVDTRSGNRSSNSVNLTGTAMVITGFVTYLVGSIRFKEKQRINPPIAIGALETI